MEREKTVRIENFAFRFCVCFFFCFAVFLCFLSLIHRCPTVLFVCECLFGLFCSVFFFNSLYICLLFWLYVYKSVDLCISFACFIGFSVFSFWLTLTFAGARARPYHSFYPVFLFAVCSYCIFRSFCCCCYVLCSFLYFILCSLLVLRILHIKFSSSELLGVVVVALYWCCSAAVLSYVFFCCCISVAVFCRFLSLILTLISWSLGFCLCLSIAQILV